MYRSDPIPEPYKIKVVEPIRLLDQTSREKAIQEAGYNTFLLKSRDVYIDLLTDSGTNAMSQNQWAALMRGDEAYAGAESFYRFVEAIQEVYGYKYVMPTHQGRGAEHILSKCLIKPGDFIPGNMYFTTTRLHQELAGGAFVDIICDEAHDPRSDCPFKGNIDTQKLRDLTKKVGVKKIPYVTIGAPVNMAGGQPVSMANLKEVSQFCKKQGIRVVLDAARSIENAYFIKEREKGYAQKSVKEILREICSLTNTCAMSAKKDAFANIGGFLATNDEALFEEAKNLCVVYEGLHTYGGLAGRDLEAIACGIKESIEQDEWVAHRISQVRYLWQSLRELGIPLVHPCGGHAVFVDAKAFLAHIPQEEFPAQTLASQIYIDGGVRAMERGIVSAGRNPKTGENYKPRLELVRLALPRRVYTQTHLDYTAEGIHKTFKRRRQIPGLKLIYEPKYLRFFQARFEPIKKRQKKGENFMRSVLVSIFVTLFISGCKQQEPLQQKFTSEQLGARFYYDLGPATLDVSSYPKAQQTNFEVFTKTCSQCHTLARPINAPVVKRTDWERYVRRMRERTKVHPQTKISRADEKIVLDFLAYDSSVRKVQKKQEFDREQEALKALFAEVETERTRLKTQEAEEKARPSPAYTGDKPAPDK